MTILNQTPVMEVSYIVWILWAVLMFFSIIFNSIGWKMKKANWHRGALLASILALIILVFGTLNKVPTGKYRYQCTFNDNVSINEIYDSYNVVSHEGELWVVEDK